MIRRVWIAKPGGGERGLGIPNVIDRIVQQAVHLVLSPHFEPVFHASSHGFRPGRSCQTAIAEAKGYVAEGRGWVVDLDLEKFFDRVNHARLLARLQQKGVNDSRLLQLIRRMLEAKVVMPDGVVVSTEEGTPQGGPLSPLLSNVVLDELDWELARRGHHFVRYADDCNIYVHSERAGQRVMATISRFLTQRLRLSVNAAKSAVARPGARHFVGFRLQRTRGKEVQTQLSQRSLRRIRRRVVELTRRNWGGSLESCITRINEYLTGWMGFFHPVDRVALYDLDRIDAHIRRRLRAIVFRQKKRRRHIVHWLRRRRVPAAQARIDVYGRHRSLWALSITTSAHKAMSTYWFDKQGLVHLARLWRQWAARPPEVTAPTQLELTLG
jgi:RNA-directed DNA polymerase